MMKEVRSTRVLLGYVGCKEVHVGEGPDKGIVRDRVGKALPQNSRLS